MDEIVSHLAHYSTSVDGDRVSRRPRHEVGRRLIDSLACAYAGIETEVVASLIELSRGHRIDGGCSVWGSDHRSTPEMATLANGTAVRFLDQNDYTVGGHPSDNIAAILAACEWVDASVDDLVAGVLVNYEVFGELGRLLIRYRGWDQATTGVIAAACAVGRVLALDVDQMANAIGMVATGNIATGKVRRGHLSMWKGVAGPYASACAVTAGLLARAGVTAPQDAFSGEFGFWEQISGEFDIERLQPDEPWHIFQAGYKYFPVQFDAQAAVWLGQRIASGVPIDSIRRIEVETSEWTWRGIGQDPSKWAPTNRETADHSLPFILAVAIQTGGVRTDDFSDESIAKPAYRRLMSMIGVTAAADITAAAREQLRMRAAVETVHGERFEFEVVEPRSKAMSEEELEAKWSDLVSTSRLSAGAEDLLLALRSLDGAVPVRDLLRPLATG